MSLSRASGVLLAAVAVLAAGCGGGDAEGTKAGGDAAPVTLSIGTDDPPGRRSGEQIEEFARQVEALTEGQVRIEPVFRAAGDTGSGDWDQKVARLVVDGELDLGLVPARAWDTEGVTTLRALNAPFLVTSDELTAEVVSSGVADTMLAGLEPTGVRGLALLPEGIRVVASFADPLLTMDDFAGTLLRVPASATTYAFFEALGATPDDVTANDAAITAGEVDGAETAYALIGPDWTATVTGNLPLWPKVTTLVVNAERFDALPSSTREALERAAIATRDWAIETTLTTAQDAAAYCEAGGTIVTASPADVAAIEKATTPVLTDLRSDAATREVIDAIEAIAASGDFPAPQVGPCNGEAGAASTPSGPLTAPGDPGDLPPGSYRVEFTPQYLRSIGLSEEDVSINAGVSTWTFDGGRWSRVDQPLYENVFNNTCEGFYDVDGDRFTASVVTKPASGECAPVLWSATWTLTDNTLTWTEVDPPGYAPYFTGESGWQRVE